MATMCNKAAKNTKLINIFAKSLFIYAQQAKYLQQATVVNTVGSLSVLRPSKRTSFFSLCFHYIQPISAINHHQLLVHTSPSHSLISDDDSVHPIIPKSPFVQVRVLIWFPNPQVTEQTPQLFHGVKYA